MNAFASNGDQSADLSQSIKSSMNGVIRTFEQQNRMDRRGMVKPSTSSKTIGASNDLTMSMNGQGVYMKVIRDSQ